MLIDKHYKLGKNIESGFSLTEHTMYRQKNTLKQNRTLIFLFNRNEAIWLQLIMNDEKQKLY